MGFGGISPWSLLLILLIVLLLFGTKRLKNVGGDLGGAIKSFKKSMKDGEDSVEASKLTKDDATNVIEGEVESKDKNKA
ncbi:MAG: twin-arginine translocase TatA/TatE family subunit [bacterium]